MLSIKLNLQNVCFPSLLIGIMLLVGCNTENKIKAPEELFQECSSGVVLIYCEHYYAITLPIGQTLYATGIGDENGEEYITFIESDIKKNCKRHFGTGFFVDSKGNIMTNRHVADMSVNETEARDAIFSSLVQERKAYVDSMEFARQVYAELERKKEGCYNYDMWGNMYADNRQLQEISNTMNIVEKKFNEWKQLCDYLSANLNPSAIKIKTYYRIGIAYNNTDVDDFEDFFGANECSVHKVSKKASADLAIIQLKNKKTPETAYVFDVSGLVRREKEDKSIIDKIFQSITGEIPMEEVKNDEIKIGQQLYVIGYNNGIELAQTKQGIKAQMTSGKLLQLSDGERLSYNIPVLGGSSGSPVIDEYGNLRGVNYAKYQNEQFSFGIPMNLIQEFLKE